jgi:hypothetical protein
VHAAVGHVQVEAVERVLGRAATALVGLAGPGDLDDAHAA